MPKGILNTSDELRKLIIQQAEKYNIPFRHIAREIWIDYDKFLRCYANIKDLQKSEMVLPDHKVMQMAKIVGLDIRVVTVIRSEEVFKEEVKEIKIRLKAQYDTNNYQKKDSAAQAE